MSLSTTSWFHSLVWSGLSSRSTAHHSETILQIQSGTLSRYQWRSALCGFSVALFGSRLLCCLCAGQGWDMVHVSCPRFGLCAEIARVGLACFTPALPLLWIPHRFYHFKHPFYQGVYRKAVELEQAYLFVWMLPSTNRHSAFDNIARSRSTNRSQSSFALVGNKSAINAAGSAVDS